MYVLSTLNENELASKESVLMSLTGLCSIKYLAPIVAFYPFIKFQNHELGKSAEEGYNWIMSSDNLKATESITKILGQAKGQMGGNPQVKMMISQMLKDGLNKKMEALKQNPQNAASINKQIDAINKSIEDFK